MNAFQRILSQLRRPNRRKGFRVDATAQQMQMLEPRCLLAAAITDNIDSLWTATPESQSINLGQHFDDTDVTGTTVVVSTPLGDIPIETFDEITPITVQNFLTLIDAGNYDSMFFHRSVPGFVVQGGGFRWPVDGTVESVENNGAIQNEFDNWFDPELGGLDAGTALNLRGTLAMAKLGSDPDSATSQWFVNLGDNSANLDNQNGGFTVFARVLYDGLDTADAIQTLSRVDAGGAFETLPVRDFVSGESIQRENVVTSSTRRVDELTYTFEVLTPSLGSAEISDGQLTITPEQSAQGTLQVRIIATDLGGNSVEQTVEYTIGAPRPITGLAVNGTQEARPVFSWDTLDEASHYQVWVNHVGVQNGIILEDVTSASLQPTDDFAPGTYRLWVRPINGLGIGEWSSPIDYTFGLQSTTISSPVGGTTADFRPTIEWEAVTSATEYDLWVNHVGVQNQVIRETLSGTSFTPTSDLAPGTYRAWVQAKNENQDAAWSAAVEFEVAGGLTIVQPSDVVSDGLPQFEWTGEAGLTYEIWVNAVGGASRVIHETAVSGTTFTATTQLSDGNYNAWVRERPADGPAGAWTDAFSFVVSASGGVGQAEILSVTGTDSGLPLVTWQAVSNAVRYELWVNQDNGTPRIIHETELTAVNFQATENLSSGTYRAWLRAFDDNNNAGDWSEVFVFEIV